LDSVLSGCQIKRMSIRNK